MSRAFVAACRALVGNLNSTELALAKEVQSYRTARVILCSRLLRARLIALDVPHPEKSVTLANKWRDIFGESSAACPVAEESDDAFLARRARHDDAVGLWLATGAKGVGVVLRLPDPVARLEARRLLRLYYVSHRRLAMSGNTVQRVLEPAGLFVNLLRKRKTGFLYQVGAEMRDALQREGATDNVLRHTSQDVSSFILTQCRPVRGARGA